MTEVIHIENGHITQHLILTGEPRDGDIAVKDWKGTVGESVDFYNKDWTKKSVEQLLEEHLIEPIIECDEPVEDEVQCQEEIVEEEEKTDLRKSAVNEIPKGCKINDDGNIVPKTPEELYKDGDWTDEDWNNYLISNEVSYLYETDWVVIKMLELEMSGQKCEHDYSDILKKRREARERINILQTKKEEK